MHMYACMKFVFFFIFKSRLTKDVLVDLLCRLIYYTSLRRHHVVEYHVFHLNMSKRQCQHYCFVFFVFVFPSIDHCHVSMLVPCSPWCRRTSLRTEKSCKMEHNRAVQQMQLSDYCWSIFLFFIFWVPFYASVLEWFEIKYSTVSSWILYEVVLVFVFQCYWKSLYDFS